MIKAIQQDSRLANFIYYDFEDSGVKVNVCSSLSKNDYIGVKIDDYYNATQPRNTPKSIDFIVSVDCSCKWYGLYLLELKNYKRSKSLSIKEIYEKFDTTVNDFVNSQFQNIFDNSKYKYKFVFLYLVADVYKETTKTGIHIPKDSLKVDSELTKKLYKIHGKTCCIEYILPTNLAIERRT